MITQVNQERATSHHPGWTRINSHSIVRVDVAKTKNARTSQLDALRKEPKVAPDMTVCEEFWRLHKIRQADLGPIIKLCFLWPRNGPSLDYCLSIHRQLFDSIRLQYDMNIYTKTDAWGFLFFSGGDERALLEMPRRARDLWKTMSLQFETEIKVCLIEPPHPEIMRRDVILQEYSDMIKPYLSGLQLPIEQAGMWEKKRVEARQDNKVIIVDRLKRALSLVPRFHGFRQMRAKFGSFVLKGYQKPKGPDEPLKYPDFRDLVVETSDRGRLCPG